MPSAIAERVRSVSEALDLSQEEVGLIVGSSVRTVTRWTTGRSTPHREKYQRLLELVYVGEAIAKVLKPEDARAWLFTPNRRLDHDTPAERISKGDYRTVIALIEALADGVVF